MNKKPIHTDVDGVSLLSRHYVALGKDKAIDRLIADNITKDRKWAAHAFDMMVKDIAIKDAPPKSKEEQKKEAQQLPDGFIKQPGLAAEPKEAAESSNIK